MSEIEREKEKLEKIKHEDVSIKSDFVKKTSLVLKISIIYLILTLLNLLFFWIATGANQMRLISEKAVLATESTSHELIRRLQPVIDKKNNGKKLSEKPKKYAKKLINKPLKLFPESDKLIIPDYQLISSNGDILYSYPNSVAIKKVSKKIHQKVYKALQLRESKGQPFYGTPNINDYSIEIFIPLINKEAKDIVFFSKIPMESIKKEMRSLFLFAIGMLGMMILVQTIFGFVLYRMMIYPVKNLAKGAEKVGQGDLDVHIDLGNKSDEVGLLIYLFNKMVASLKEKTEKLELTIEELERHNEMMQNELKMAQNIQSGIMPQNNISDRVQVGIYYSPLERVSGDYYDIFPLPDGSVGLLITDASGHGVPAALVTIMAKMHFSSMAEKSPSPSSLFESVNKELSRAITTSDYLTAFYLVIKPDLTVDYCNASHQKAIIFHRDTGEIEELDTGGFFIGAIEESPIPYETHQMKIKVKDRIILYTDGMVEGTNPKGEEYSNERFEEMIKKHIHLPVEEFNKIIVEDVDRFAEGEARKDDYTLFTIEVAEVSVKTNDLLKQGETAYQKHDFASAKKSFSQLLASDSSNLNAKLYLANSMFFLKEYKDAIEYFEDYTKVKRTNPYAHLKLGVCYAKSGNENRALEEYEKAIQINKDLAEAYGQMAISYANKGDLETASSQLNKALQLKPGDARLQKLRTKIDSRIAKG